MKIAGLIVEKVREASGRRSHLSRRLIDIGAEIEGVVQDIGRESPVVRLHQNIVVILMIVGLDGTDAVVFVARFAVALNMLVDGISRGSTPSRSPQKAMIFQILKREMYKSPMIRIHISRRRAVSYLTCDPLIRP